jgi:hypothetical protein
VVGRPTIDTNWCDDFTSISIGMADKEFSSARDIAGDAGLRAVEPRARPFEEHQYDPSAPTDKMKLVNPVDFQNPKMQPAAMSQATWSVGAGRIRVSSRPMAC